MKLVAMFSTPIEFEAGDIIIPTTVPIAPSVPPDNPSGPSVVPAVQSESVRYKIY